MNFLFHTIIEFDKIPVYYNVFKSNDHYFIEILQNPQQVAEAKSFTLHLSGKSRKSSELMQEKQTEILMEEIMARDGTTASKDGRRDGQSAERNTGGTHAKSTRKDGYSALV